MRYDASLSLDTPGPLQYSLETVLYLLHVYIIIIFAELKILTSLFIRFYFFDSLSNILPSSGQLLSR